MTTFRSGFLDTFVLIGLRYEGGECTTISRQIFQAMSSLYEFFGLSDATNRRQRQAAGSMTIKRASVKAHISVFCRRSFP